MKKYDSYKDSGAEWVNQIPFHWSSIQIKNTVKYPPSDFIDGDWIESNVIQQDGIRYLTTGNIGATKYKEQGNGYISEETFKQLNCTEVYPGDLLISRLNEPIGRTCLTPKLDSKIVVAVDIVIYRPIELLYDRKYIMYQMNSSAYTENANFIARGSTMHRISRTTLGSIKLCIPPIEEQKSISSYLDKKCAEIDKVIATQQRRIELLQELKQSTITNAVTRGLNPNVKMKDSGVEWIGEVPEHWDVTPLKRYSIIKTGTTPSTKNDSYYESEDVNWFTPSDFSNYLLEESNRKLSSIAKNEGACKIFPPKTIYMIGIGGTIGKIATCESEASANQQINAIIVNNQAYYKFIGYCLISQKEEIILSANTVTLPIINQDITGSLFITVPPLSEQQSISSYIDKKCSEFDSTIAKAQRQIGLLQEYKQSLITEVVTGKRKVC